MVEDGYDVYGVIDASGAESPMADGRWPMAWEAAVATLAMHGVKVRTWYSVAAELISDWRCGEAGCWPLAGGSGRERLGGWGRRVHSSRDYTSGGMEAPAESAGAT